MSHHRTAGKPNAPAQVTVHGKKPFRLWLALMLPAAFLLQRTVMVFVLWSSETIGLRAVTIHIGLTVSIMVLGVVIAIRWRGMLLRSTQGRLGVALVLGTIHTISLILDLSQLLYMTRAMGMLPLGAFIDDIGRLIIVIEYLGINPVVLAGVLLLLLCMLVSLYWRAVEGVATSAGRLRLFRSNRMTRYVDGSNWWRFAVVVVFCAMPLILVTAFPAQARHDVYRSMIASRDAMAPDEMLYVGARNAAATRVKRQVAQRLVSGSAATVRPLVLIVVDSMRADSIGEDTPYLTRLIESGYLTHYRNAYSTCTYSYCGIMSILSGRYWDNFGTTPAVLPDFLRPLGYRSYFLLSGEHRTFSGLSDLYGRNVAIMRDDADRPDAANDDRNVVKWLAETEFSDPARSFVYLHLMSAHAGGAKPGPTAERSILQRMKTVFVKEDRSADYVARYRIGLRQADGMIRQLMRQLNRKGMLNDAVVIITADHGERLGRPVPGMRSLIGHGGQPDWDTLAVPLLVHIPGAPQLNPAGLASTVDIVPTFLAAIQAKPRPMMSGQALTAPHALSRAVPVGTSDRRGTIIATASGPRLLLVER